MQIQVKHTPILALYNVPPVLSTPTGINSATPLGHCAFLTARVGVTLLLPAVTLPQSAWTGDNPIFQGTSRSNTPSRSSSHRLLDHSKVKIWKCGLTLFAWISSFQLSTLNPNRHICQTYSNMPRGKMSTFAREVSKSSAWIQFVWGSMSNWPQIAIQRPPAHCARAVHHEPSNYYCVELHKHYLSNIYCIVEPHEPM